MTQQPLFLGSFQELSNPVVYQLEIVFHTRRSPNVKRDDHRLSTDPFRNSSDLLFIEVVRCENNSDVPLTHQLDDLSDVSGRRRYPRLGFYGTSLLEAKESHKIDPILVVRDNRGSIQR